MKYQRESKMTMRSFLKLACLCVAAAASVRADTPGLITFDDLNQPGPSYVGTLPAGYAGFQWNNFAYMDAVGENHQYGPSGYFNGMVSASNVVFNGGGYPASLSSSTAFNFVAADVTGAWKDGLQVEAKGFLGSTLVYDRRFTLDSTGPSLINFDFFNVTRVDFTSSGGVEHGYPSSAGDGEQFVLDNIVTIPEPSVFALAGLGLAMLVCHRLGHPVARQSASAQMRTTTLGEFARRRRRSGSTCLRNHPLRQPSGCHRVQVRRPQEQRERLAEGCFSGRADSAAVCIQMPGAARH